MSSSRSACFLDPGAVAPLRPVAPSPATSRAAAERAAYDAGVEAGKAAALAGLAEAHEAARRALEDAASALRQAAEQLRAVRAQAVQADLHDAMELVVGMVEALVGELPQGLNPRRLEEALALAPPDELAVVRLHPDDASSVLPLAVDAKVVADESIERGGCVVEVGPTRIDAQVGPALRRLRSLLGTGGGR